MLTVEQRVAIEKVAEACGWDKMPIDQFFLIVWAAFHYYVMRLGREWSTITSRSAPGAGADGAIRSSGSVRASGVTMKI